MLNENDKRGKITCFLDFYKKITMLKADLFISGEPSNITITKYRTKNIYKIQNTTKFCKRPTNSD